MQRYRIANVMSSKQQILTRAVRTASLFCLAFLIAATLGCGTHESSVTGTVTLDDVPLSRGTVTFHPKAGGAAAYARIDAEGHYTIKTGDQEGLKPGEYVVTVVATTPPPPENPSGFGKLLTPERYGTVEKSGLEYTVSTGHNRIDLRLKTK